MQGSLHSDPLSFVQMSIISDCSRYPGDPSVPADPVQDRLQHQGVQLHPLPEASAGGRRTLPEVASRRAQDREAVVGLLRSLGHNSGDRGRGGVSDDAATAAAIQTGKPSIIMTPHNHVDCVSKRLVIKNDLSRASNMPMIWKKLSVTFY